MEIKNKIELYRERKKKKKKKKYNKHQIIQIYRKQKLATKQQQKQ